MEIQINKEIRNYTESIFFGMNLRQMFFSILAIGAALGIYFGLRDVLSIDTVSWLCILGTAPFALLGFVRYNGMPAERCLAVIVQSLILSRKRLVFVGSNLYYDMLLPVIKKKEKEMRKRHA